MLDAAGILSDQVGPEVVQHSEGCLWKKMDGRLAIASNSGVGVDGHKNGRASPVVHGQIGAYVGDLQQMSPCAD